MWSKLSEKHPVSYSRPLVFRVLRTCSECCARDLRTATAGPAANMNASAKILWCKLRRQRHSMCDAPKLQPVTILTILLRRNEAPPHTLPLFPPSSCSTLPPLPYPLLQSTSQSFPSHFQLLHETMCPFSATPYKQPQIYFTQNSLEFPGSLRPLQTASNFLAHCTHVPSLLSPSITPTWP